MTKSDLRTGMTVVLRCGIKMNVYKNVHSDYWNDSDLLTDGRTWLSLIDYTQEMKCLCNDDYDIVRVELIINTVDICRNPNDFVSSTELVWKREDPKRMTLAEIEAALGYEIEIIAEE